MVAVFAVDQATGETASIDNWGSLSYLSKWNDKSGGTLVAKDLGGFRSAEWLTILRRPFGAVLIADDGRAWSGFPYPSLTEQSDTSTSITFASDLSGLAARIVTPYTDPSVWNAASHRKYSGDARTVIRTMINDYCGPGSFEPVDNLTVSTTTAGGPSTSIAARAQLNVLEWVTLVGVPARQRVTAEWSQTQKKIVVEVEACADLSSSIVFAPQAMNLTGWSHTVTEPLYDTVIVAGQGELTSRQVVVKSSTRVGRRKWAYFDQRNIDNLSELTAKATELLESGRGSVEVKADMIDGPGQKYGTDFRLGDLVKVVAAGAEFVEPITEVLTTATPGSQTQRRVTAGFGPLDPKVATALNLEELSRKVSQIGAT